MVSERECISRILRHVRGQDREYLIKGIGDDCAVIKKDGENVLLLSTDTLIEGVHFDLAWHPPRLLGRKCASVNLSDIAAMGGKPSTALLSVGFPGSIPSWFDEFMAGFVAVLNRHDTLLIGGDTVKSRNDLIISVTITGEGNRNRVSYRSGAEPGDLIWVSGFLGNAAAGLELCRKGLFRPEQKEGRWHRLVQAHLDPVAQIGLGRKLAESGFVHAMMDISDGLATDLAHLCRESRVGGEMQQDRIPIDTLLIEAAAELDRDPIDWALKGGEDYQLLFTTGEAEEMEFKRFISENIDSRISCIGRITGERGVFLRTGDGERREVSYLGYDHFDEK